MLDRDLCLGGYSMKKYISLLLVLTMLFTLSACRKKKPASTDSSGNTTTTQTQDTTQNDDGEIIEFTDMVAVSVPAVTETIKASDGTVLFQYTYQNMSLVLNNEETANKIILDFLNRVDTTRIPANSIGESAKSAYTSANDWISYLYSITYSPMRIDGNVLSLFGNHVVYNGAFHPDRTCVSANYNLQTGESLSLADIMDPNGSLEAICQLVLDVLAKKETELSLDPGYEQVVQQRFKTDISHDEAWYFNQTGLCFYFAPYEIAPYITGVVHAEVPYSSLKNIIKPEYLPARRAQVSGKITVESFDDKKVEQFTRIAETVMSKDGKMYLLHTDEKVQDVRITVTDVNNTYTAFATYGLMPGDAIMLQIDDSILSKIEISYVSGGKVQTTKIAK